MIYAGETVALSPSGDTSGATDAAAIARAVAELPAPGGVIRLAATGTWYINCGQIVITQSGVFIDATGCYIKATGAGDMIRMYDSSAPNETYDSGGLLGFPLIDGALTTGNACALHAGDILQLMVYAHVKNFTAGTTSKGVWLDNNYAWTEQASGRILAQHCRTGVMLDNSANTSGQATGSFDRLTMDIFIITGGLGDGLTLTDGAFVTDGRVGLYGNMAANASTAYSALNITGSNGSGSSLISNSRLDIGVENAGGTGTQPTTINFGAGGNEISQCWGGIDFSAHIAFTSTNNSGQFIYSGDVLGDASLNPIVYDVPAPTTISTNGQTIFTGYYGTRVANNAGSFTGLILQAGSFDGQRITIINRGTGSYTFAASGTSHVADGASDVIAASTAATYVWSASTSLWYRSV